MKRIVACKLIFPRERVVTDEVKGALSVAPNLGHDPPREVDRGRLSPR